LNRPAASSIDLCGRKSVTLLRGYLDGHYLPRPLYDVEPVRGLIEQGAQIIVI